MVAPRDSKWVMHIFYQKNSEDHVFGSYNFAFTKFFYLDALLYMISLIHKRKFWWLT
jgi:hypothetical protein